jgi:hypothetical protein
VKGQKADQPNHTGLDGAAGQGQSTEPERQHRGDIADALTPAAFLEALWPVLIGAALVPGLWLWGDRLPRVPEGDITEGGIHQPGDHDRGQRYHQPRPDEPRESRRSCVSRSRKAQQEMQHKKRGSGRRNCRSRAGALAKFAIKESLGNGIGATQHGSGRSWRCCIGKRHPAMHRHERNLHPEADDDKREHRIAPRRGRQRGRSSNPRSA